jgi:hypothetical protein
MSAGAPGVAERFGFGVCAGTGVDQSFLAILRIKKFYAGESSAARLSSQGCASYRTIAFV